jgi:hypothetical protein
MPLTQSYVDGLTRQALAKDYLINGMFPCQSDIVRGIRGKKVPWEFNDRFEYRMLLATTNTGGSINEHVFKENVALLNPGELTYGVFRASYGVVMDGFDIDMMANLETEKSQVAFINDYSVRVHSMRVNMANLFKTFVIGGRYGVVHRLSRRQIAEFNAQFPGSSYESGGTASGMPGQAFTLTVPINVFHSGFKMGQKLIKTTNVREDMTTGNGNVPWGPANMSEMYMVLDNQPKRLTLQLVAGAVGTPWMQGQFLQVAANRGPARSAATGQPVGAFVWNANGTWGGIGQYDEGRPGHYAHAGAMEGLPDLFPWHIENPNPDGSYSSGLRRAGLELPFREQPNRFKFSTEQAGGWYVRGANESIIDALMNAFSLTAATVPHREVAYWINPDTLAAMGYQEAGDVRVLRDIALSQPLIYQRGVTATDYQIGSKVMKQMILDHNMPTDIVKIGPIDEIYYNTWDNAFAQLDQFYQEMWSSSEPPKPEDIRIPDEVTARMDIGSRILYGAPLMANGKIGPGGQIHPQNRMPVAFQEMGALFTELPHSYTMVNLRREIIDLNVAEDDDWMID